MRQLSSQLFVDLIKLVRSEMRTVLPKSEETLKVDKYTEGL